LCAPGAAASSVTCAKSIWRNAHPSHTVILRSIPRKLLNTFPAAAATGNNGTSGNADPRACITSSAPSETVNTKTPYTARHEQTEGSLSHPGKIEMTDEESSRTEYAEPLADAARNWNSVPSPRTVGLHRLSRREGFHATSWQVSYVWHAFCDRRGPVVGSAICFVSGPADAWDAALLRLLRRTCARVPRAASAGRVAANDGAFFVHRQAHLQRLCGGGAREESALSAALLLPLRPQPGARQPARLFRKQAWLGLRHLHKGSVLFLRTDAPGQEAGGDPRRHHARRLAEGEHREIPAGLSSSRQPVEDTPRADHRQRAPANFFLTARRKRLERASESQSDYDAPPSNSLFTSSFLLFSSALERRQRQVEILPNRQGGG